MQWDYVYADLQVEVMFDADTNSVLGQLNDRETQILQQLIYRTLTQFCMLRGFYAVDIAALQAKLDSQKDLLDFNPDGE